ncbi:MAG: IS630 family transposase [Candidatus Acidiferrales bacterium]
MRANQYDARMLSPQAKEALRRRVVRAVVAQGMRPSQAVRVFGVSRTAIHVWVQAYRAGGARALAAHQLGRPKRSRLAGHQAATAVQLITGRCPDQLQLPFALWTRQAVCQLLAARFALRVSVWTAGRYLRHWGLTPQKPVRRAYERNPAAVQRWLQEQYPAIRAKAKQANAEIHWGDEMGLRSDHQSGRSYGRRGHTPVIPGTGQRFGCNMISTITNRGTLRFMVFRKRFTQAVLLAFLRRLLRSVNGKIFLIVDGHPVHHGKMVQRWLAAQQGRIKLLFLPGYSPELNPDELLNQDVKSRAGRQRPQDQAQMMRSLRGHLRSTQKQPAKVRRYFHEEHVAYAA